MTQHRTTHIYHHAVTSIRSTLLFVILYRQHKNNIIDRQTIKLFKNTHLFTSTH